MINKMKPLDNEHKPYTMAEFYKAMDMLETVLQIATKRLKIVATENAPDDYKTLVKTYNESNGTLFISNRDQDNIIWSSPWMNVLFRAYHDLGHIEKGLDFSYDNERIIGTLQAAEFMALALKWGADKRTTLLIRDIILAEINGQIEYYEQNKCYVENQRDFCLCRLGIKNENDQTNMAG